ncbi:MAG: DUF1178 family protein [Burkholderiaceae bacterium]
MKVLNLQCSQQHLFEGWFGSEHDFLAQQDKGLLECPLCGDSRVIKLLSAPRLNLGHSLAAPDSTQPQASQTVVSTPTDMTLQAAWLSVARRIMDQTEDVGKGFAEEARKIHYGETQERAIRGQATEQETESLLEEGIAVMPLLLPESLKQTLQ